MSYVNVMESVENRMARNSSEPLPFMDQVMEICDRILDKQPAPKQSDREKQEESESSAKVPPREPRRS